MHIYEQRRKNIIKTWVLMGLFFSFFVVLGWMLYEVYDNVYIFYGFVIFSVLSNIISYWYSDKIALSVSGAFPADEEKYKDLHNIVDNLSITAGIQKPKIYIIKDDALNAFATGRDPQHSAIAVTEGLLNVLDKPELEGVLAHELSHIQNRDVLVMTVSVVLLGMISILADMFIRASFIAGERKDIHPVFVVGVIISLILAPIVGNLINLAISRKREYLADASGALLTRYPEGLIGALEKIAKYNRPLKRANHAISHLFIANPFGDKKGGFINKIEEYFSTHPPIQKRIEALKGIKIDG